MKKIIIIIFSIILMCVLILIAYPYLFFSKKENLAVSRAYEDTKILVENFEYIEGLAYKERFFIALTEAMTGKSTEQINQKISEKLFDLNELDLGLQIKTECNFKISFEDNKIICELPKLYTGNIIFFKTENKWKCSYTGINQYTPPNCKT